MGVLYSSSKNDRAPRPAGVVFKKPDPPIYIAEGNSDEDQTKIEEKDQSMAIT